MPSIAVTCLPKSGNKKFAVSHGLMCSTNQNSIKMVQRTKVNQAIVEGINGLAARFTARGESSRGSGGSVHDLGESVRLYFTPLFHHLMELLRLKWV